MTDTEVCCFSDDSKKNIIIDNVFLKSWACDQLQLGYDASYKDLYSNISARIIGANNEGFIFQRLINESNSLDFVLYLLSKGYRDHYTHQFNVASLGDFLLSLKFNNQTLLEIICENTKGWTTSTFKRAWWAAALLHDHAYLIDYLVKLAPKIPNLAKKYPEIKKPITKLGKIFVEINKKVYAKNISQMFDDLFAGKKEDYFEYLVKFFGKELETLKLASALGDELSGHHIWGAMNIISCLRDANDEFIDENESSQAICRAIFLHHKNVKIKLSEDPLAFLLKLCDSLQEWGRPRIVENDFICDSNTILLGPIINKDRENHITNELNVIYEFESTNLFKDSIWTFNNFATNKNKELNNLDFRDIFEDFHLNYEIHTKHKLENV
jgi:hypothetical protein